METVVVGGLDAETEVETVGSCFAANEVNENPEGGVDATAVTAP